MSTKHFGLSSHPSFQLCSSSWRDFFSGFLHFSSWKIPSLFSLLGFFRTGRQRHWSGPGVLSLMRQSCRRYLHKTLKKKRAPAPCPMKSPSPIVIVLMKALHAAHNTYNFILTTPGRQLKQLFKNAILTIKYSKMESQAYTRHSSEHLISSS